MTNWKSFLSSYTMINCLLKAFCHSFNAYSPVTQWGISALLQCFFIWQENPLCLTPVIDFWSKIFRFLTMFNSTSRLDFALIEIKFIRAQSGFDCKTLGLIMLVKSILNNIQEKNIWDENNQGTKTNRRDDQRCLLQTKDTRICNRGL